MHAIQIRHQCGPGADHKFHPYFEIRATEDGVTRLLGTFATTDPDLVFTSSVPAANSVRWPYFTLKSGDGNRWASPPARLLIKNIDSLPAGRPRTAKPPRGKRCSRKSGCLV